MKCLLDTHIVIWAMVGSEKLSSRVRDILESPDNLLYVSSVSVWEVAIKHALRPTEMPVTAARMIRFCHESGIVELPVGFRHSLRVATLPLLHNDPFDRMLVAQALEDGLSLLSHDKKLPPYGDVVIPV